MKTTKKIINKGSTPYISANIRQCRACWRCITVCPKQVFKKVGFLFHRHIVVKDGAACTGCQKCLTACPHDVFTQR